jgi:hypothetical protein
MSLPHNVTHCSADHGVESPEVDEGHECFLRGPICFLFSVLWRRMTNEFSRGVGDSHKGPLNNQGKPAYLRKNKRKRT